MRSALRSVALVDAWFDTLRPEQQEIGRVLRNAVMGAVPSLGLSIKWGNLVFTHDRTHAVAIVTHKEHAHLQVFNGAVLVERFAQLEGSGKGTRHLKFRYRQPVDEALVRSVVAACVEQLKADRTCEPTTEG